MRMRLSVFCVMGLFVLTGATVIAAAGSSSTTAAKVTFSKDVVPILQAKCVECHRQGGGAPMSLMSYTDVRPWAKSLREKVSSRTMPPWHADPHFGQFSNDRSLTEKQVDTIVAWVDQGSPKGEDKDLPPMRDFPKAAWTVGTPDLVFTMPQEFEVPADGTVPYKHFQIATNLKEDIWVEAAEAIPGSKDVVHHIVVFVVGPGERFVQGPNQDNTILVGQAPGEIPSVYPKGYAKRVKAGSTIIMQMHYTPNGVAAKDRSSVGFVLSKGPVKKTVMTKGIANWQFQIPPNNPDYLIESQFTFKENAQILSFMPHMHVRGKDFLYRAVYPDGKSEVLLSVPAYDFNWQTYYHLKSPKSVPAGTKIECVAHYDNSTGNKGNPDPNRVVRPGEQTWEEMMIGWMDYILENQTLPTTGGSGR